MSRVTHLRDASAAAEKSHAAVARAMSTAEVWRRVLDHHETGTNPDHMTPERVARDTPQVLTELAGEVGTAARWATMAARNARDKEEDTAARTAAGEVARARTALRVLERRAEELGLATHTNTR